MQLRELSSQTENIYDTNTAWNQPPAAQGELRHIRRWDNRHDRFVETASEYDARGNLTKTTSPTGVVEDITYDPVYSLFPITRRGPVGYTEQTWHPQFPVAKTETDLNGRVTTFDYDAYGRRTQVINPDGSTAATRYLNEGSWTGPDAQRRRVRTEHSDDSPGDGVSWREDALDPHAVEACLAKRERRRIGTDEAQRAVHRRRACTGALEQLTAGVDAHDHAPRL